MIEKLKSDCVESIAAALMKTSIWRLKLAEQYADPRNAKAAEKCAALAEEAPTLTDGYWLMLKPAFETQPAQWREALSKAGRQVIFHHRKVSFPFFVRNVIELLTQNEVAA
jgi:hypothetical protein